MKYSAKRFSGAKNEVAGDRHKATWSEDKTDGALSDIAVTALLIHTWYTAHNVTSKNDKVVPGCFDPYSSAMNATDHLLTVHGRDSLQAAFISLPSVNLSQYFDRLLIRGTRGYSNQQQDRFFVLKYEKS